MNADLQAAPSAPAQWIYTVHEAAAFTRFSTETIYRAVRSGELRKLASRGRTIRIAHAALIEWLGGEPPTAGQAVRVGADVHDLVDELVRGRV